MQDEDKIMEAVIKEAQEAPEPGELKRAQVLDKGKEKDSAPMVAKELTSAGYVYIYDTKTGIRSKCNRNMLPQHLKKKRLDGSTVYTLTKPDIKIKVGTFKCLLHADGPNRKHYDELGLAVCKKSNLISPHQVRRHMQKRHKVEWETIEQERIDAEKAEDRAFQRSIMGKVIEKAEEPKRELYISDKDKAKAAKS